MVALSRLIGRVPKFDSIAGYMCNILHWLPKMQRAEWLLWFGTA